MGPFVPDPISNELNLAIALIIGVAFGAVLEQAGFSSSRRLAGLFYGYDFTVLRVFFTAAITAMCGIMLLDYAGLLDTSAIYINPLWLWPAVVGGVIMGVGFILGGYCPGTSICAAAIGKIDAMFFVGGAFLGVFTFAEMFPTWQKFHFSSAFGPVRVYDSLGMSAGVFAFVLIAVALFAFTVTSWIEKRVSSDAPSRKFRFRPHAVAAGVTMLAGIMLIALPDRKSKVMAMVADPAYEASHDVQTMTADELAFRIVDRVPNTQIIDVRSPEEFNSFALPGAANVQVGDLFGREWNRMLAQRHLKKVIVADAETDAREAYLVLDKLGYGNLAVLEGGLSEFRQQLLADTLVLPSGGRYDQDVAEFRIDAKTKISQMIRDEKNKPQPTEKKKKKVAGGC
ncbi:MAG: YeeE/YedE family protein [bacterium]|nr:YeeE/YedE family protein [bacterium]